jgi:serine O-acetyltransferase
VDRTGLADLALPAGATAVGVPARILLGEDQARREDQAAKMGFSAYGISADMNDPIGQAIHRLIDHAAASDARLDKLIAGLQEGGVDLADARATAEGFDPKRLNQMID